MASIKKRKLVKKEFEKILAVVFLLALATSLLFPNFFNKITGMAVSQHKITIYSSKSGLMSSGNMNLSFKNGNDQGMFYIGGRNDYRQYEYFNLASIPSISIITNATLTKYRVLSGERVNINVRGVSELWREYQSYSTKKRYPLLSGDETEVESTRDLVVDVTDIVQEMVSSSSRYESHGFEFSGVPGQGLRYFYFRNAPLGKRPKLEITFGGRRA